MGPWLSLSLHLYVTHTPTGYQAPDSVTSHALVQDHPKGRQRPPVWKCSARRCRRSRPVPCRCAPHGLVRRNPGLNRLGVLAVAGQSRANDLPACLADPVQAACQSQLSLVVGRLDAACIFDDTTDPERFGDREEATHRRVEVCSCSFRDLQDLRQKLHGLQVDDVCRQCCRCASFGQFRDLVVEMLPERAGKAFLNTGDAAEQRPSVGTRHRRPIP